MKLSHSFCKVDSLTSQASRPSGLRASDRRLGTAALGAVAILLATQAIGYSANVLVNAGFEATPINTAPYDQAHPGNPNGYTNTFDGGFIKVYLEGTSGLGWQTTASGNKIELWRTGTTEAGSVDAPEGMQFAEINAFESATLFQDVPITLAGLVDLSFWHRGRVGLDTMNVAVTYLGVDAMPGGGDDVVEFTKNYTTDQTAWVQYSELDQFTSVAGGTYRFAYTSVSTSTNNALIGNFIDDPSFGVDAVIPEPTTGLVGLIAVAALLRRRRN